MQNPRAYLTATRLIDLVSTTKFPELVVMKLFTAASLLLVGTAFAQVVPEGFTPAPNATLDVYYGTEYVTPGKMLKKSSMKRRQT